MELKSYEFRRERQRKWAELEALISRVDKSGLSSLTAKQLHDLPVLHHAVLSSLSVARSISLDRNLLDYLEGLAARSYFCLYGSREPIRSVFGAFVLHRFPAAVRALAGPVLVSALVTALGFATAFAMTAADPEWYYSFVSPEMASGRDPAASTSELRAVLYAGTHGANSAGLSRFAAFLFTHNARVGMMAFAFGFAAGLPTLWLLFTNGLVLGGFAALYHSRGLSVDLWGWLLPHGVTELLAVVLCGGAGLAIGGAVVFAERDSRLRALARVGRTAGVVVFGTIAMFFVAGLIEGIFRQRVTDITVRYVVVLATAAFWFVYLRYAGRRSEPRVQQALERAIKAAPTGGHATREATRP